MGERSLRGYENERWENWEEGRRWMDPVPGGEEVGDIPSLKKRGRGRV